MTRTTFASLLMALGLVGYLLLNVGIAADNREDAWLFRFWLIGAVFVSVTLIVLGRKVAGKLVHRGVSGGES